MPDMPMNADSISITVLVDNQAGTGLKPEHGLSLWIEAGGKRILFDTGQGKALVENARQLGVPLEKTDFLVLSHGHYDHTGGVASALTTAPRTRLVLHPETLAEKYRLSRGKPAKSIGIPNAARTLVNQVKDDSILWADRPLPLAPNIGVSGPIPRETPFEDVGGPFFLDGQGEEKDAIIDDLALWFLTPEGLIVCVGCCHAGLINTLTHVQRLNGNMPIRALIGGFHLLHADDDRIERTLDALQSMAPGQIVPCHCTGKQAIEAFKDRFEHVDACSSGMVFRFQ
jgi:7,8-dihydropterin-6-yl-methyl-4-(beta-D-ribofuranosyl)aminobenzene 5'-phosphate synthase